MKKYLAISLLFCVLVCCTKAQNGDYTAFKQQQQKDYATLDSLERSYTSMPAYYVEISSYGCLYDVLINDNYTDRITDMINIKRALIPFNTKILHSGKQKLRVKLKPYAGLKAIIDERPFSIRIGYKDFKEDERNPNAEDVWHWIWQSPEVIVPKGGLPYFEIETEFEAQVPRTIEGWSNCVDLREIPDIEERVVAEFKRIRQLYADKKYDEIEMLNGYKDFDVAKALYQSSDEIKQEWVNFQKKVQDRIPEEWQPIEDYELVFYADGRLVTLESKKETGFRSALLWFREEEIPGDDVNYTLRFTVYDMRLGMLKGTDKLIPIR